MQNIEEQKFFEGPDSRWKEFKFIVKVLIEFIKAFRKFHFLGPCITVFGSARFEETDTYYILTKELAAGISKKGFTVLTGGGPGLMEAANKGAREAGGKSVGCNIVLPFEQKPNEFLDVWVNIKYFFVRKVILTKYSYAFIVMPGGYGTLDEFFESLTLIQTNKIISFPVILMGKEYHSNLIKHIDKMVLEGTISETDKNLFCSTDSIQEALNHLEVHAIKKFELRKRKLLRPIKMIGE